MVATHTFLKSKFTSSTYLLSFVNIFEMITTDLIKNKLLLIIIIALN